MKDIDITSVKLKHNVKIRASHILWEVVKNRTDLKDEQWIVAGDFNSSSTYDHKKGRSVGAQEMIDRWNSIGLRECLLSHTGRLTPTYINKTGKILHQLDHMYVTDNLLSSMVKSSVGDRSILDRYLSDHLPIITDFDL